MFPPLQDLYRIAPEIVLCGFGMLVMLLAPIVPRRGTACWRISLVGAVLALAATNFPGLVSRRRLLGPVPGRRVQRVRPRIVMGVAFLVILGSINYLKREDLEPANSAR